MALFRQFIGESWPFGAVCASCWRDKGKLTTLAFAYRPAASPGVPLPQTDPASFRDIMAAVLASNASEVLERTSKQAVRIEVVKGGRFGAEMVAEAARAVCPHAEIEVYCNGLAALERIAERAMDLYLIDLELPDMDGLDLIGIISKCWPASRNLLLAGRLTEMACLQLSQGLADNFFDFGEEHGHTLAAAIRRVLDGGGYASCPLREARRRSLAGREPLERLLSPAESLVFAALGDGSDHAAVSELLGLSINTVNTHGRIIKGKLGLRTDADLIREAVVRGFVRFASEAVVRPGSDRMFRDLRQGAAKDLTTARRMRRWPWQAGVDDPKKRS